MEIQSVISPETYMDLVCLGYGLDHHMLSTSYGPNFTLSAKFP